MCSLKCKTYLKALLQPLNHGWERNVLIGLDQLKHGQRLVGAVSVEDRHNQSGVHPAPLSLTDSKIHLLVVLLDVVGHLRLRKAEGTKMQVVKAAHVQDPLLSNTTPNAAAPQAKNLKSAP
jgi:hypothetical protein